MSGRIATRWHLTRWARGAPGPIGFAIFAALPVLYFIGPDRMVLGDTWSQWSAGLTTIATIVLAAVLSRDVSRPDPSWIWLFQKRHPAADFATTGWLLAAVTAAAMVAWWVVARYVAEVGLGDAAWIEPLARGCQWLAVFVVASAVLYAAGALGSRSGVEILVTLAFLSVFEPLASLALGRVPGTLLHLLLPPMSDATSLRATIEAGDLARTARILVHVAAYAGACLGIGTLALARWRPTEF